MDKAVGCTTFAPPMPGCGGIPVGLNADPFRTNLQLVSLLMPVSLDSERDVRLSGISGMPDGCVVHPDDLLQQKTHGHKGRVFGIDHDVLLYFKAPFAHFHPVGRWNE